MLRGLKQDLTKTAGKGPLPRGCGAAGNTTAETGGQAPQCGRAGLPGSVGPHWRWRGARGYWYLRASMEAVAGRGSGLIEDLLGTEVWLVLREGAQIQAKVSKDPVLPLGPLSWG